MTNKSDKKKKIGKAILYAGGLVAASGITYFVMDKKVVTPLKAENFFQRQHIDYLRNLCNRKDKAAKGMASELLRKGSSLGGQVMQDLKMYQAA